MTPLFSIITPCHNAGEYIAQAIESVLMQKYRNFIRMPIKSTFWDVLETCTIPCLTVLLSREIIGRTRFRDIPKEDFVFWLDILKKGVAARNCGRVLASYRVMKSSRSSNKFAMIKNQWYVLRKIEGVKIPIASYFMAKFLFYGFRKYLK